MFPINARPPSPRQSFGQNGITLDTARARFGHWRLGDSLGFGFWVLGFPFRGAHALPGKVSHLSATNCARKVIAPHAAPAEAELSRHRAHHRDGFPARDRSRGAQLLEMAWPGR